jgi:hypothetical protein
VAKKTTKLTPSVERLIEEIEDSADADELAEFFTRVIYEVNPSISKADTYDLLFEAMVGGTTMDEAKLLGLSIRATASSPTQSVH